MPEFIKTTGIILRRTNYGEVDRILSIITPIGKISAIAKGVRKPQSKLAGGIEMFSLNNLQLHEGRSNLNIITSARMVAQYTSIIKDYDCLQLASSILKKISIASEHSTNPEYYSLAKQSLEGLNHGLDLSLTEAWFQINLSRTNGEEINLYRDISGNQLSAALRYEWNVYDQAFSQKSQGQYGEDEIKMLRLLSRMDLITSSKIKTNSATRRRVYDIIKLWEN